MEFRVLGPLEAIGEDGRPVRLGGQRERALLALLLTRPNQVVSVDALVDGVWGGQPPRSAEKTLQSHVVRLRRTLEPARPRGAPGEVLVTREPGYLLQVAPGALDAARFEQLVRQGRGQLAAGDPQAGAATLRRALSLWRGPAFQEFQHTGFAQAEAGRLAELRLGAIEDRVHADLAGGKDRELVAELEGLVGEQPLRERLWAALLLALYRSGRQADALRAYQRARSMLVEELGIEPGAELRRLQAAILAQDPALDVARAERQVRVVRELPGPLALVSTPCLGRATELALLQDAWKQLTRDQGGAVFVAGPAGIGKTRLAAELAHEVHDQGALVCYGRCAPPPAPPLQPLAQVLSVLGASLGDLAGAASDQSPAALGVALAALLQDKAGGQALLLVVDELHLADPTMLEALQHLHGAGPASPLVMLGLYRDDLAAPALGALLASVDPGGAWRLRLGPLGAEAVAGIAALYAGEAVPAEVVAGLCVDTGGVPLLVHQAAREWATARAGQRLDAAASRGAADRGELRAAEAEIAEGVAGLQRLRQPPPEQAGDRGVVCPYKGLARFEPSDAGFFCGRERLVAELVARLVGAALLGVVGASGSGKSSLLRAGLVPALREGVLPGSQRWRQVLMRPGEHPMRELARLLDVEDHGPGLLLGAAQRCTPADGRLLLVVDQFEELFTACQDPQERASFLNELLAGAGAEQGAVVVVGLRADYYGRCAEHAGLATQLGASQVLVGPMRPDELRRAIELPAERAGLRVEPALTQAMVADVAGEPGGLPLLSTALLEGWERRQGRTLTLAGYHQAGGVHGAVARLAERAWLTLGPDEQAAARRLLLRLAGPGEGAAVTRRRVALAELEPARDQPTARALQVLTARRLLTASEATVEVAHEALLREWPRLRGWLEEDVQGRAMHRHLTQAAAEWHEAGRDPGELYRGARLTGVLDWARDHDADLNDLERQFLDASRAAAEREVADARRRAEQEARRARRERGISRRLRLALAGLAVVLIVALAAGSVALVQRGRARAAALVADARRLGAQALVEKDLDRSLLLAAQAVRLDDSVDTQGPLLASLLRSPQALGVLRGDGGRLLNLALSPDGRTLAAVDSNGKALLWDVGTRRRLGHPLPVGPEQAFAVAFSPNGRVLALGGVGGLSLWDVQSRHLLRRLALRPPGLHEEGAVGDVVFSQDGRVLASSVHGGNPASSVILWNTATGARLRPPPGPPLGAAPPGHLAIGGSPGTLYYAAESNPPSDHGTTVAWDLTQPRQTHRFALSGAVAVTRDGKTLAVGQLDGSIALLDASSGRRRRTLTGASAQVNRLHFSWDGTMLASAGQDGATTVWDTASGGIRETFRGHGLPALGVVFSPDGRTLYTCSLDGSIIIWDLSGMRRFGQVLLHGAGQVTGIAFAPRDPTLMATASADAKASLWNVATGARVGAALDTHSWLSFPGVFYGAVNDAIAFSPNGRLLATADHATAHGNGAALLWDVARQVRVGPPLRPRRGSAVNAVAFSPDGRTLATGVDDSTVVLWNLADKSRSRTLMLSGPASALAFSPDGHLLAAGTYTGRAMLWDLRIAKLHAALSPNAGSLNSVRFSPDGRVFAATANSGQTSLWDTASGKQIGAPLPGPPNSSGGVAAFKPASRTLAVGLGNGTVVLWDLDPAAWARRACLVAGRSLTREEWTEFLPGRPYRPACVL